MVGSTRAPAVGVLMVMALAIPAFAHADCVALWKTARDAERTSTLVFSGTVIKSSPDVLQTSFQVDRVWKGDVRQQTTLTLYPGLESHSASYFKEGMPYLVFALQMRMWVRPDVNVASPETPVFEISACSPTRPVADAQDLVKQLGRGRSPRP
jgi:hypothetical protein